MTVGSNVQRLAVVPDVEESDFPLQRPSSAAGEPVVCSFCFDTGMEVVLGKGARRCQCRAEHARKKLLVGRLTFTLPLLRDGLPQSKRSPHARVRSTQVMSSLAAPLSSRRSPRTPLERRRLSIPTADRGFQQSDDFIGRLRVLALQRSPLADSLHRHRTC